MTIIIWGLFIATLLPFIAKMPLAYAMSQLDGYDNSHPRTQQARLTGFGARALAAHQNAFESVIIFAPAALLAIATGHTTELVQQLVIVHIIARVAFNILYLLNIGLLRSGAWGIATIASFAIIWQCIPF